MILCDFNNTTESFGKKGDVLRILNIILHDEDKVFVPETLVLSLDFFQNTIKEKLLKGKTKFLTKVQQKDIINEIRTKFKDKKIVVRSSASCEDSILFTNSGQYDSFLNLETDEEILLAINKTFYSFISPNALEYYKINNIDPILHGMSVLIQEVAPVKTAGVMFTVNPVTGDDKPIIEFCDGLGEDVVSGRKKVITIKDNYNDIPQVLNKLIKIGKKIEFEMGRPQDIEWGIDNDNNIYIFQARPIIINDRNIDKIEKINLPEAHVRGVTISNGFTIGQINELQNYDSTEIILQSGKLTSKDLTTIINSKSIILKTGGYLSHFANIIREFNKPSVLIEENHRFDSNEIYIIDGYNGCIYKLNDLNLEEQNKAYWNYLVDLIYNGNKIYLDSIGIKSHKFISKIAKHQIQSLEFKIIGCKLCVDSGNEILEIEFCSFKMLNDFVKNIRKKEK